jgi:hypothetical protein
LRSDFHVLREMDGSPGGCHPPFDSPLSLSIVYALRRYAGMLFPLGKIVGSTVKMQQYVRTREAQPHSPSPMTLAGKGTLHRTHTILRQSTSHMLMLIEYWQTVGHGVLRTTCNILAIFSPSHYVSHNASLQAHNNHLSAALSPCSTSLPSQRQSTLAVPTSSQRC